VRLKGGPQFSGSVHGTARGGTESPPKQRELSSVRAQWRTVLGGRRGGTLRAKPGCSSRRFAYLIRPAMCGPLADLAITRPPKSRRRAEMKGTGGPRAGGAVGRRQPVGVHFTLRGLRIPAHEPRQAAGLHTFLVLQFKDGRPDSQAVMKRSTVTCRWEPEAVSTGRGGGGQNAVRGGRAKKNEN